MHVKLSKRDNIFLCKCTWKSCNYLNITMLWGGLKGVHTGSKKKKKKKKIIQFILFFFKCCPKKKKIKNILNFLLLLLFIVIY